MKLLTISLGLLTVFLLAVPAMAQEDKAAPADSSELMIDPVVLPQYPGGEQAMLTAIYKNVRYPRTLWATQTEDNAKVYVSFLVDTLGQISNVIVKKGFGGGLDEEAVRVVKMLQPFKPAMQAGKPVSFMYILPITFYKQ